LRLYCLFSFFVSIELSLSLWNEEKD
jgi:hypothetical protein